MLFLQPLTLSGTILSWASFGVDVSYTILYGNEELQYTILATTTDTTYDVSAAPVRIAYYIVATYPDDGGTATSNTVYEYSFVQNAAPTGLQLGIEDQMYTLSWNGGTNGSISGEYFSVQSYNGVFDTPTTTSKVIDLGLQPISPTYYFKVTYHGGGYTFESEPLYSIQAPTNVSISGNTVSWDEPDSELITFTIVSNNGNPDISNISGASYVLSYSLIQDEIAVKAEYNGVFSVSTAWVQYLISSSVLSQNANSTVDLTAYMTAAFESNLSISELKTTLLTNYAVFTIQTASFTNIDMTPFITDSSGTLTGLDVMFVLPWACIVSSDLPDPSGTNSLYLLGNSGDVISYMVDNVEHTVRFGASSVNVDSMYYTFGERFRFGTKYFSLIGYGSLLASAVPSPPPPPAAPSLSLSGSILSWDSVGVDISYTIVYASVDPTVQHTILATTTDTSYNISDAPVKIAYYIIATDQVTGLFTYSNIVCEYSFMLTAVPTALQFSTFIHVMTVDGVQEYVTKYFLSWSGGTRGVIPTEYYSVQSYNGVFDISNTGAGTRLMELGTQPISPTYYFKVTYHGGGYTFESEPFYSIQAPTNVSISGNTVSWDAPDSDLITFTIVSNNGNPDISNISGSSYVFNYSLIQDEIAVKAEYNGVFSGLSTPVQYLIPFYGFSQMPNTTVDLTAYMNAVIGTDRSIAELKSTLLTYFSVFTVPTASLTNIDMTPFMTNSSGNLTGLDVLFVLPSAEMVSSDLPDPSGTNSLYLLGNPGDTVTYMVDGSEQSITFGESSANVNGVDYTFGEVFTFGTKYFSLVGCGSVLGSAVSPPAPLSDISLNGTLVSWTPNSDISFVVSCTYEDGSGFVFSGVTDSFFELSGEMDITRDIAVMVTGYPSNISLTITYNPPPPPPTPLSDLSLNGTILTWASNDDTMFAMSILINGGSIVFVSSSVTSPFDLSGNVDTTQVLEVLVFGLTTGQRLFIIYNPLPPPPAFDLSLNAVQNADGSVTLNWLAPSVAPDSYMLVDGSMVSYSVGATDTSATLTGVTFGITYVFTLTAVYSGAQYSGSLSSIASIFIDAIEPPAFDLSLNAVQNADGSVTLNWLVPGVAPDSYTLVDGSMVSYSVGATDTSATLMDLSFGITYVFTLTAVYSGIQYSGSLVPSSVTVDVAPPVPTNLTLLETTLSWSGRSDVTYNIYVDGVLHDLSGITELSADISGNLQYGIQFAVSAVMNDIESAPSIPLSVSIANIFNMSTVDVATRKQILIDNAASFPSPILTLSSFDITPFLTNVAPEISIPQNITMILPSVDIPYVDLPEASAPLYFLGTPGTTVVYTVDGVSSEMYFDTSSIIIHSTTVQIGEIFVLFGRVYTLVGCGSALSMPVSFTADISGFTNNDGTANITWTDVSSADRFQVEDGAGTMYPTISSSTPRTSATVGGLKSVSNTFYVRAIYDASGSIPEGSVLSTDFITFNGDIVPPAWTGSNVEVVDNKDGSVTVSWTPATGSPTYTVAYSGDRSGSVDGTSPLVISGFSDDQEVTFSVIATYDDESYTGVVSPAPFIDTITINIPQPLSDILLNGTVVSWTPNDDTSCNVSATFTDGSYNATITGDSFDLSGAVDLALVVEIVVTGQTTGQQLSITYNPPPPPPTPLSDISLNGTVVSWTPNDDTSFNVSATFTGGPYSTTVSSNVFNLSGNVDLTKTVSVTVTGYPSNVSLSITYNPPAPPPTPAQVPCFLENAPVLTPSGYKKISKLVAGDLVMTGDGRSVPIQSVARKHVAAGPSTNPYVIPKGLYGATKRLLISPNHCVATSKGMVEARLLGLEQEDMTGSIHYYNLELPSWAKDTMVVAGVTVESLAPVRRVRLSIDQFKAKLVRQYGKITPEILAKVERTCRIVDGGYVEFPALIRKDTESNPNTFTK